MIGSDIFLFPAPGPDFLRVLKSASLYSSKVHTHLLDINAEHVLPVLEEAENQLQNGTAPEGIPPAALRVVEYFRFLVDNEATFRLLTDSGILPRVTPAQLVTGLAQQSTEGQSDVMPELLMEPLLERFNNGDDPNVMVLDRALVDFPPTLLDLAPLIPFLTDIDKSWNVPIFQTQPVKMMSGVLSTVPPFRRLMFAFYLLQLSYSSERNGVAVLCASELHQQAVWAARDLLGFDRDGRLLAERKLIRAHIGNTVVQRYLPDVDSLEFDDILELRARCKDELEAFRVGLHEIAVQVDTTQPIDRQRLQIEDVITTKVDPAVRNLQASLWATRLDILKKITSSWDSLAKATVPFLVSVAVGAPMNMQTALAAIGGFSAIAGPFIEAEVERRKLLHASQWSVLLKLPKLGA